MIVRFLNLIVIGALILAAAYVYRIKFDATVQAEHLAKLRTEVRHERDDIAMLRAQWGQLDNPERIEMLAKHYLQLKPVVPTQFDALDRLPERPPRDVATDSNDPIGGMIGNLEQTTGSIPTSTPAPAPADNAAPSPAPSGAPHP